MEHEHSIITVYDLYFIYALVVCAEVISIDYGPCADVISIDYGRSMSWYRLYFFQALFFSFKVRSIEYNHKYGTRSLIAFWSFFTLVNVSKIQVILPSVW